MLRDELELMGYGDIELLDGFDSAFVGIADDKAVYDYDIMLECLDMDIDDAVEYMYKKRWDNVIILYKVEI